MKNSRQDCYFHLLCKAGIVVLLASILAGCAPALYEPTGADAAKAGIQLDSLRSGRALYVGHCGSCHNLYLPKQYTAREWEKNLDEMAGKTTLNEEQKRMVMAYLKNGAK